MLTSVDRVVRAVGHCWGIEMLCVALILHTVMYELGVHVLAGHTGRAYTHSWPGIVALHAEWNPRQQNAKGHYGLALITWALQILQGRCKFSQGRIIVQCVIAAK